MEHWKINLSTLWVSQTMSIASFGLGLPFIPYFIQQLGLTDPTEIKIYTGLLAVAPAVTMAVMAPVWGLLSDRFGRKMMIMRAMGAAVIVIGCMGLVNHIWQLVALRALQGLFTGTITASTTFIAANTPKERLTYALGVISSSNFLGYSLGPLVGGFIAEAFGYRTSFFAGAGLMLLGLVLVVYLVREDKNSYGKKLYKPGMKPKWNNIFTPYIILLLFMLFFQRISRSVFSPYMPLYVQGVLGGIKGAAQTTGAINGIVGFATATAGIIFGRLGDRINKMKLSICLLASGVILSFGLYFTNTLPMFIGFYGLLFFLIGGIEPVITSSTAAKTPASQRGFLFGIQGLAGSIGWIMSPVLGSWISITYEIKAILFVIPCVLLCSLVVAMLSLLFDKTG